jgi:hypothetical protein
MRIGANLGLGVLVAVAMASGCGTASDTSLTFSEFQALIYQEPDTGIYVVNGDEIIETEEELRAFYEKLTADDVVVGLDGRVASTQQPLIVNRVKGKDDAWSPAQAQNLTYCVSQSSFGNRYADVVSAMNSAASAWESAGNVNFVHDSAKDGNCTKNTDVVFNLRQVCSGQYLARAFFPSSARRSRELLVDCSSFGNISPWTLAGVLRHELGHTIGFRHEHTRPESGTCFEDNNWRALTPYDSSSVMHYPQCNGTNNGDLSLTNSDKAGAAALYP